MAVTCDWIAAAPSGLALGTHVTLKTGIGGGMLLLRETRFCYETVYKTKRLQTKPNENTQVVQIHKPNGLNTYPEAPSGTEHHTPIKQREGP